MRTGKLSWRLLEELLSKVEIKDERVILGPRVGEDAAVIALDDRLLVAKTDPITFATDLIGWYAVHINANDIAVMGAKPLWFLATILVPEDFTEEGVGEIFHQILSACNTMGITLLGGHTEVTQGISRPIVMGAMLGEAKKEELVLTAGAKPGDHVVLTKGIAIEGTALLARDAEEAILASGLNREIIQKAKEYLLDPGISVVQDAQVARAAAPVHCMHDPTEGGLIMGLFEIAKAAGTGITLYLDSVPVLEECQAICRELKLDPLGLLSSGALLITVAPQETPKLLRGLGDAGIKAYDIGRVTPAEEGLKIEDRGGWREMKPPERDELARFFDELAS